MVAALNIAKRNAELLRIALCAIRLKRKWKENASNVCNKRTKAANRVRDRKYALKVMAEMTDFEFQRMFRVSRDGFAKLLNIVRPDIAGCDFRAIASSGSAIRLPFDFCRRTFCT